MPLTGFQREVLQLLAAHRNPESHAGGGAVINRSSASPRYSSDLDLFHDTAAIVQASAEKEIGCLYMDSAMAPMVPVATTLEPTAPLRHFGSLAGAWPRPA